MNERQPLDGDKEIGEAEDDEAGRHISQFENSTPWLGRGSG